MRKMSLEKFVSQGQKAQAAVDAVLERSPADDLLDSAQRAAPPRPPAEPQDAITSEEVLHVPTDQVYPSPTQPRDRGRIPVGEKWEGLVASVRSHGVLEPLIVRLREEGGYELVIGERRLLAARQANRGTVPIVVRNYDAVTARKVQLIENLQREDLDPMEEARAFQGLLDLEEQGEKLYTQAGLALEVGVSQPFIANRLRLLKLPEPLQIQVAKSAQGADDGDRTLSPAHAQILIPYAQYPWVMEAVEARVKEEGLPTSKLFPDFVHEVLFGFYRQEEGQTKMLVRPLGKGSFYASGRTIEFNPETKGHPRDWSQVSEDPGPGPCTKCPHIRIIKAFRSYGDKREIPHCMLVDCFEGKQKAHRAAQKEREDPGGQGKEKLKQVKADPSKVNLGTLKHGEYETLEPDKSHGYTSGGTPILLFDLEVCRKSCPHKGPGGEGTAYRKAYRIQDGTAKPAGAVCLYPSHFKQLQQQGAAARFKKWREDLVAKWKGLHKQAMKEGLSKEDLSRLLVSLLREDMEPRGDGLGQVLGWQKVRVAQTELFQEVRGQRDKALQLKTLAAMTRDGLEILVKFALLVAQAEGRGRR